MPKSNEKVVVDANGTIITGRGSVRDAANSELYKRTAAVAAEVQRRAQSYARANIFNRWWRKYQLDKAVRNYKTANKALQAIGIGLDNINNKEEQKNG